MRVFTVAMTLWEVWVRSLDLYKTLTADGLVAASGVVEVGRIVEEADWALAAIFVQKHFERLPIDEWIIR